MLKEAGPQMYEKMLEKEPLPATVGQVRPPDLNVGIQGEKGSCPAIP